MRRFTATGLRPTSIPSIRAEPPVGKTRVVSTPIVVVLPAPFGPSKPKNSPRGISNEMPSSALTSRPLRDFGWQDFLRTSPAITVSIETQHAIECQKPARQHELVSRPLQPHPS